MLVQAGARRLCLAAAARFCAGFFMEVSHAIEANRQAGTRRQGRLGAAEDFHRLRFASGRCRALPDQIIGALEPAEVARMSARPKPVRDFDAQSQRVGATAGLPTGNNGPSGRGTQAGGSAPTPQAALLKRGPAGGKGSGPADPQKLRG